MPRVEVIPEGWEDSEDYRQGNGTPTFDVCRLCVDDLEANDLVNYPAEMGSLDVDHPDYDDCDYHCEICCKTLKNKDN